MGILNFSIRSQDIDNASTAGATSTEQAKKTIKLAQHSNSLFNADFRRNTANFKIDAYWGLYYNHNSFVYPHTHFPHAMSFGYYINVPVGSSPFTLMHNNKEDMDFYPKEGQLFVFDSSIQHVVNPSPVVGRMTLAGDIAYLSRFGN